MKEQDHVIYLMKVRRQRQRIEWHRKLSRMSIMEIIQKFQDNLENNYKENKKRGYIKRQKRLKNSKWVMNIRTVKKFRKLYFVEAMVSFFIPCLLLLFFWNYMVSDLIGAWVVVGCGLFGLGHMLLTFMMDYAVYNRDKKENSWFF